LGVPRKINSHTARYGFLFFGYYEQGV